MLSNWEHWACANHYVSEHGEDAGVIAAMRCDELLDQGDYEGARTYQAIILCINRLLDPPSGLIN